MNLRREANFIKKEKLFSVKDWIKINSINDDCIYLDDRVIKILEIIPINFKLKSFYEQKTILYEYCNFLKKINFDIQICIQVKSANFQNYKQKYLDMLKKEKNALKKSLLENYIKFIDEFLNCKKSISRRFFVVISVKKENKLKEEISSELNKNIIDIKDNLTKCGNKVIELQNFEIMNVMYSYLNKELCNIESLNKEIKELYVK